MKMLENPEKKPSDPEVMPGVIKSKISTENLFSYCHGRVFKREHLLALRARASRNGSFPSFTFNQKVIVAYEKSNIAQKSNLGQKSNIITKSPKSVKR